MAQDDGTALKELRDELARLRDEVGHLRGDVRRLSDREQIVDCLHRYTRGLDRLDPDLLASAYYDDAKDDHGLYQGSPSGFVDWVMGHMQEWDASLHLLDLNNIQIDGDAAQSECYVLFTQRRADGEGLDFGGARYLDRLERRDGQWRIAARKLLVDWTARTGVAALTDAASELHGSRDRSDPSYQRPLQVDVPGAS